MRNVPLRNIGALLGASIEGDFQVAGYQIDSRCVEKGDLFFALKGNRADGHDFLQDVKNKGALGAVVSLEYRGPDFGLILLRVDKVEQALRTLARELMKECKAVLIGITGSLGKTTTKDFIATLLEGKFKVGKTLGSANTKLTYPLTLLNRRGDEEVMVLELGMSEPGDMGRLLEVVAPDIGVVTKIARVHTEFFPGGLAEVARGKGEIFSHPRTKKALFYHEMNEYKEVIDAIKGEKISFSLENRSADYFLSSEFFVDEKGVRAYQLDPPYKQPHMLHNFLAAISVARLMKMEWDEINQRVAKLKLPKMRLEEMERDGVLFINDAYNANPDSMEAALSSMPQPKEGGKRIAVLGRMVELGAESEKIHRELGRFAQKYIDHLFLIGKEATPIYEGFGEIKKPVEQFFDFKSLADRLKELTKPGDVVLVKASRSVQMEKLFNELS